jgi:hypothetical protein
VLIALYELHLAAGDATRTLPGPRKEAPPATTEEFERFFAEAHQALDAIQFFKTRYPEHIMRSLRALTFRAAPDSRELSLLRADGARGRQVSRAHGPCRARAPRRRRAARATTHRPAPAARRVRRRGGLTPPAPVPPFPTWPSHDSSDVAATRHPVRRSQATRLHRTTRWRQRPTRPRTTTRRRLTTPSPEDASQRTWRERAEAVMPTGASTGSKRGVALWGDDVDLGLPTHLLSARGCRVVDVQGTSYVDCTMALGSVALGYGEPRVTRAVVEAASEGPRRSAVELARGRARRAPAHPDPLCRTRAVAEVRAPRRRRRPCESRARTRGASA